MDLLRTTENKPWKGRGKRGKEIEYLRDVCLLDFDEKLNWTLCLNGERETGTDWRPLKGLLSGITSVKEKRRRNKELKRRLVVWTKQLSLIETYIRILIGEADINRIEKFREGHYETITMEIANNHFEFRNFELLSGETIEELKKTYKWTDKDNIDTMLAFLEMRQEQGFEDWVQLRYTLANSSLKLFYNDFTEEELEEMKLEQLKRSLPLALAQFYEKAGKAGIISYSKDNAEQLLYGVRGFDINEAYGSQFVRGDDFPLSRPYKVDGKELSSLIKEDRWFFLVMKSEVKIEEMPRWLTPYIREIGKGEVKEIEGYYYFFEKYDYKVLKLLGLSLNSFKESGWRIYALYTCDQVGYLNKSFRAAIVNKYNRRKELKKIGDPAEKMIKAQLKFLYGKGLSKRTFTDAEDYFQRNFYKTSYVNEVISFHALARNRYEIMSMMKRLNFDYVSVDTDGIKSSCRGARRLFAERNKEIKALNEKAGFKDTKIGLWKYEGYYRYFIQFSNKVYAYEDGGKLICKFAGCLEKAWREYFKNKTITQAFIELSFSDIKIPGGIIRRSLQVDENKQFYIKKESYSYGINGIDELEG